MRAELRSSWGVGGERGRTAQALSSLVLYVILGMCVKSEEGERGGEKTERGRETERERYLGGRADGDAYMTFFA